MDSERPDRASVRSPSWRRPLTWIVIAIFLIGASIAGLWINAVSPPDGIFYCAPQPTQDELREQAAFVQTHLSDATVTEMETSDCDDHGGGYVEFTTRSTAATARDAFLRNGSCTPYDDHNTVGVRCPSGKFQVIVTFETGSTSETTGYLWID